MKTHQSTVAWLPWRSAMLGATAATAITLGSPAPAIAAAPLACSLGALSGLIGGLTINTAATVAATTTSPAYCDVVGHLDTSGDHVAPGSAGFEIRLPATWNGKFLFFGVGGLAGSTYADFSAHPVDYLEALGKGYATAITDTGHLAGNTDASWALLANDKPDTPALTDYYYRATHDVTVAGKKLVEDYYGGTIQYAYFDGCSNGGRQAMVEATQFPTDYDGIIAGAPFRDIRIIAAGTKNAKALFASPSSYLAAALLPAIDTAVNASCDSVDGVSDGLIQNPAQCNFKPQSLICGSGQTTNCLSAGQAKFLTTYISALYDNHGQLIYPGYAISNLANGGLDAWSVGFAAPTAPGTAEPWGNDGFSPAPYGYQFDDHIIKDIITLDAAYDLFDFPVSLAGVITTPVLHEFDSRTAPGDAGSPFDYGAFIKQGRKLLWYHGLSDPALPPFRDYVLYEQLSHIIRGGYTALQNNIRLFMVPGMQHCGGGVGPNYFDTLTPLETWVERGTAPESIIATHFPNNDTTKAPDRTMPLCPFPTRATLTGTSVMQASSWSCTPNQEMLKVGLDGAQAGLLGGNQVEFSSDIAP